MKIIEFLPNLALSIEMFESVSAKSVHLGDGSGKVHVYCIYFESGSHIGTHRAGYGQLFLVMNGEGWVAGSDGERIQLKAFVLAPSLNQGNFILKAVISA